MATTLRQHSKIAYEAIGNGVASLEQINAGSLQRIADATEVMATNHLKLMSDRDMYKRWYDQECEKTHKLERRIAALKGVITKLKKK